MEPREELTLSYWLKGEARERKRADSTLKLSVALDATARRYGFTNWNVASAHGKAIQLLNDAEVQLFPRLDQSQRNLLLRQRARDNLKDRWPSQTVDLAVTATWQGAAQRPQPSTGASAAADPRQAMEAWFRANYTRLIDFAFYDPESESGFAWPDIEPREVLQDQFADKYPVALINEVASGLLEEGPWGEEHYGDA